MEGGFELFLGFLVGATSALGWVWYEMDGSRAERRWVQVVKTKIGKGQVQGLDVSYKTWWGAPRHKNFVFFNEEWMHYPSMLPVTDGQKYAIHRVMQHMLINNVEVWRR